jgi:hypothetical protein
MSSHLLGDRREFRKKEHVVANVVEIHCCGLVNRFFLGEQVRVIDAIRLLYHEFDRECSVVKFDNFHATGSLGF